MSAFPLPAGWAIASIADVIRDVQTADPSTEPNVEITYFDIGSIDNEAGRVSNAKTVLGADAASRARQVVQAGDVLFSTVRPNLRAIALVPEVTNGIASTGFCVLRAAQSIHPHYLYFYARSEGFLDVLLPLARGVSYPAVRGGDVVSQRIPVAPATEQTRIVEKLEELLSGLDAGVAELKAAQKKLTRYRQSLLKAAVEGALTAQWRTAQSSGQPDAPAASAESGAALLARILTERRSRWETRQLAKFQAQGKTPPKDWQAKYPAPAAPDNAGLPPLPDGWVWTSVGMVADSIVPNRDKPLTFTGDIPWITTPDFEQEGLYLQYSKSGLGLTPEECLEYRAKVVPVNSVIMTCVGRLGLSAVLKSDSVINQQLHAFLPATGIVSEYLAYVIQAESGWLHSNATATTISYLNKEKCESLPLPLPPADEMLEIAGLLDIGMQSVLQQLRSIDYSLKQSAAQRKNILQAAFSGQLVPQDPADEPASALLARIRAEREKRASLAKAKKPKPSLTRSSPC